MDYVLKNVANGLPNSFTNGRLIGAGVPHSQYAKQPDGVQRGDLRWEMTRGELMKFLECPDKWLKGVPEKVSAAMRWGGLIDCLSLVPAEFAARYAVTPETYLNKKGEETAWRNDRRIDAVAKWLDENADKEPLSNSDYQEAKRNLEALFSNPAVKSIIEASFTQVMVRAEYRDKETGLVIPVKALLDIVPKHTDATWGKCLADLKLTTKANRKSWTFKVRDEGYHVQGAFYSDIYRCARPTEDRVDWVNVVCEDHPPYESVIWPLSADSVEIGRGIYQEALAFYCRCLKENKWPGYNDAIFGNPINIPVSIYDQ